MFTEEWEPINWEVSRQSRMESVVLSHLRVGFSSIFRGAADQFFCEARKKPHRSRKTAQSARVGAVENAKLMADGEQMSGCHCACVFLSTTGRRMRAVTGRL